MVSAGIIALLGILSLTVNGFLAALGAPPGIEIHKEADTH